MYIPLEEGEEIIAKVHKHWWFIAWRIIGTVVVLTLPFLAWAVIRAFEGEPGGFAALPSSGAVRLVYGAFSSERTRGLRAAGWRRAMP